MSDPDPFSDLLNQEMSSEPKLNMANATPQQVEAEIKRQMAIVRLKNETSGTPPTLAQKSSVLKDSLRFFARHPVILLPLLVTWSIYAGLSLWTEFSLDLNSYSTTTLWLMAIAVTLLFSTLLTFSCSLLLEFIQQIRTGDRPNLIKALSDTLGKNFLRFLPLTVVWSVIWFLLMLLSALLSPRQKRNRLDIYSARNAAISLTGLNDGFVPAQAAVGALGKGIRMIVFLIMPAIAWENLGFVAAVKKGLHILKVSHHRFIKSYLITIGVSALLFAPVFISIPFAYYDYLVLPDWGWWAIILYLGFAWSYSIYIEQLYGANLYLQYLAWEKQLQAAKDTGGAYPALNTVPAPSLLNTDDHLLHPDQP